jgi:hypothetical protein
MLCLTLEEHRLRVNEVNIYKNIQQISKKCLNKFYQKGNVNCFLRQESSGDHDRSELQNTKKKKKVG